MEARNSPERRLRVFLLEDNPDDVELELHEIRRAHPTAECDVARNKR